MSILCAMCIVGINSNKNTYAVDAGAEGNVYEQIDAYLADACEKAHFPAMSITIVDKTQT